MRLNKPNNTIVFAQKKGDDDLKQSFRSQQRQKTTQLFKATQR
jgi:hypothetical protein